MSITPTHPLRTIRSLSDRAVELEAQEQAVASQIREQQQVLRDLVLQRCAIAHEQRRGIGSTLQKKEKVAADWAALLQASDAERRAARKARTKALADLHLQRAWVAWGHFPQIVVAFELSKENVGEMFWVRDGITEILPHLKSALPGYKCIGISHSGVYSIRYFLLCAETNDHFQVVETYRESGDVVLFEGLTLQSALEYAQNHFSR
jgi:hypothetical protein